MIALLPMSQPAQAPASASADAQVPAEQESGFSDALERALSGVAGKEVQDGDAPDDDLSQTDAKDEAESASEPPPIPQFSGPFPPMLDTEVEPADVGDQSQPVGPDTTGRLPAAALEEIAATVEGAGQIGQPTDGPEGGDVRDVIRTPVEVFSDDDATVQAREPVAGESGALDSRGAQAERSEGPIQAITRQPQPTRLVQPTQAAEQPAQPTQPAQPGPVPAENSQAVDARLNPAETGTQAPSATISPTPAVAVPSSSLPAQATPAVSNTAPPSPAPSAQMPLSQQVSTALAHLRTAPTGEHVLVLRVHPEELGPIRVTAVIGADGVRMELAAPTDQARDALRGVLGDLRREMAATGLQADLSITSSSRQSGFSFGTAYDGLGGRHASGGFASNAEPGRLAPESAIPDPDLPSAPAALLSSNSQLDLFI